MSAGVGSRVAALEGTLCTWHDSCRRWRLGPPKPGVDVGPGAPAAEGVGLDAGGGPTVEGAGDQVLWATRVGRKARTRQRGGQVCVCVGGSQRCGLFVPWAVGPWSPWDGGGGEPTGVSFLPAQEAQLQAVCPPLPHCSLFLSSLLSPLLPITPSLSPQATLK